MDHNPSQGDTIAGNCKIVNTESSSGSSSTSLPQVTSGSASEDASTTVSGMPIIVSNTSTLGSK